LTDGRGYVVKSSANIIPFAGDFTNSEVKPLVKNDGDMRNGWNAVGNPYTSAIGITTSAPSKENFLTKNANALENYYAAVYVWNETGAYSGSEQFYKAICNVGYSWAGYYGISTIYATSAQVGQGFLINAGGNGGEITFTKAMQYHETGVELKSATKSWPGITLMASYMDQTRATVVAFNERMTTGLDKTYDVGLLASDYFEVYTHLVSGDEGVDLEIQSLPEDGYDQLTVPVGLDLPQGGLVIFRADGIILPEGIYPVLEDRLLKVNTPLKSNADTYTVTVPANTYGTGRFYLHFGSVTPVKAIELVETKYSAWFANRKIIIFGKAGYNAKAALFDMNGRKLGEYRLLDEDRNEIPAQNLVTGVYLIQIQSSKGKQVIKVPVIYK